MAAYTGNIAEAVEIVLEGDQIATSLRQYMDLKGEFSGTATDLLNALNSIVPETQQKAKGWPKRPNALSRVLRRIAPPLRKVGIEITFDERVGRGRDRKITISRVSKGAETSSTSSTSSAAKDSNGLLRTMSAETSSAQSSADGNADDTSSLADNVDENIVRANPLTNKAKDDADDKDDIFPTFTNGSHVCAQCGRDPPDGAERPVACGDGTVWLHPECRRFWASPAALNGNGRGEERKEPYAVLGPAPAGERCVGCGKGAAERIRYRGGVDAWHEACVQAHIAALANPPVQLPDLGPDPPDEYGAPQPDQK
jgi:hypothetical protein